MSLVLGASSLAKTNAVQTIGDIKTVYYLLYRDDGYLSEPLVLKQLIQRPRWPNQCFTQPIFAGITALSTDPRQQYHFKLFSQSMMSSYHW